MQRQLNPLFKDLGVGVGLRPAHHTVFLSSSKEQTQNISWVEVISENFMTWPNGNRPNRVKNLEKIRQNYKVALHGVSLNIGSADKLNLSYLKNLKSLIETIQPEYVSDHLCWTGVDGKNMHDLFPLPYTNEAIQNVVNKIDEVQNYLGRRILIENVSSYMTFQSSQMTESQFVSEVANQADCGLLLDINNIYVSSINHGFDAHKYLMEIPHNRVAQIHLAGHKNENGFLIDTHDEPVPPEVWSLYQWSTQNFGLKSAMIERDGNIPEWDILKKELDIIEDIRNECSKLKVPTTTHSTTDYDTKNLRQLNASI